MLRNRPLEIALVKVERFLRRLETLIYPDARQLLLLLFGQFRALATMKAHKCLIKLGLYVGYLSASRLRCLHRLLTASQLADLARLYSRELVIPVPLGDCACCAKDRVDGLTLHKVAMFVADFG